MNSSFSFILKGFFNDSFILAREGTGISRICTNPGIDCRRSDNSCQCVRPNRDWIVQSGFIGIRRFLMNNELLVRFL